MSVTPDEVRRIAALARLRLDDAEIDRLTIQLRSILAHVEQLETVDHAGSAAGLDAPRHVRAPRRDEPGADPLAVPPDRFAIDWRDGFFVVPRLAALDPDAVGDESA
ncbi:MAG: aspartyl/glutamyl-tRNA amidotransferase subunit C [Gemmatimonadetes bacterium]|nr:aspartyl/glutamyl-tRNA amidotransferase subunit C [Gemmatimonadota bacterium]